jgi:hypothetical protein
MSVLIFERNDTVACSRGCCETQADHYRSIAVANKAARDAGKTTVDVHDHHEVAVHERWDGQDVTVRPPTVAKKMVDA